MNNYYAMKMCPPPPAVLVHLVDVGDHHELPGQCSARLCPLLGVSHRCSRPGCCEPFNKPLSTLISGGKYHKLQVKVLY